MEILSPCLSSPSLNPPSLLSTKSPTVSASASPQPPPSLPHPLALASASAQPRRTPTTKRSTKSAKTHPPPPITNPTTTSLPRKKVLVPIGTGTEEMEAVILVDVLRRSGAEVIVASVEPELQIEASGGTKLVADSSISACSDQIFDLVALPGGMPGAARLRDCEILKKITSRQAEEKRLYGAICAAPAVALLPWGLLKRKQLTTSRGPGTAFEFALSLVEQLSGESIANDIKEVLMVHGDGIPRKEEFNKVEWSVDHTPHVLVPVANGSEEIEVVTVVDILRRAKVKVVVASVEKSVQILASQGTKIVADKTIDNAAESIYDLIILPGGAAGAERLHKSKVLKKLLKEQESAGRIYGAVSTSPSVLHKQGILKEKKAAAHPSVMNMLTNQVVNGAIIVIDGKLITSRGLATATYFALAIVNKLFGNARARSVAEGLVFLYPKKHG